MRQTTLGDLRGEERLVKNIRERVAKSIPLDGPKTVPEAFQQDIERLTDELTSLNELQEQARRTLVTEQETLESLKTQVKLARHALDHHGDDEEYLLHEPHEVLVCPTCHAEHHKTFMDILRHSEDARVLQRLVAQLEVDARKVAEIHTGSKAKLRELDDRYAAVAAILETRREKIKLDDVLRGMGAEATLGAFAAELDALKQKIDLLVLDISDIDAQLGELTDTKRSKAILRLFRSSYEAARVSLNLPAVDTKRMKLNSRPDVAGSGGPRSILAYYSAIWQTCAGEHGSFSLPLIIDAPQQQGQDTDNLPIIIKHIAERLPKDAQVIMAVETPTDVMFDKTITPDKPYQFLREDQFEAVDSFVRPRIQAMYARLVG
jgi:predicted  nucleic acid-binding Zn-ribbon protein